MNLDEAKKMESELDDLIRSVWPNALVDGVVDWEKYLRARVKILWILKEPNRTDFDSSWIYREVQKHITDYPRWRSTYQNILRISYGVLEEIYEFAKIPRVEEDASFGFDIYPIEEIAIININKSGGGSETPPGKMDMEYQRTGVKDALWKQISLINSDIIINAHQTGALISDLVEGQKLANGIGCKYVNHNNRLIVDAYHPNLRGNMTDEDYCNGILAAIRDQL